MPPTVPQDVLYGFGRVDMADRVADRAVISALGWRRGDRLTLTAEAGVVTARRDPAGMVAMTAKPYIVIPAGLRRRCGLRPGDRVLVAVAPADDMLAAYSLAVVDQALRAHGLQQRRRGELAADRRLFPLVRLADRVVAMRADRPLRCHLSYRRSLCFSLPRGSPPDHDQA